MGAEPLLFTFLRFLVIAVLVAYTASRLRIPYTVGMVLVGLGVSLLRIGAVGPQTIDYESELILLMFLPGLLFEASFHVNLGLLRANLRPILLLAIPGVLVSTVVVGLALRLILDVPLAEALLFGIMISPTDPIAVIALFRELGVNRRLGTIMEGESLLNDGVAIVGFALLAGIAGGSEAFNLGETLIQFFVTVAGGAAVGLALGFLFAELMKRTDSPLIDIALTTILAYGSYLFAEDYLQGQVSPVIVVVVAGLVVGNYGARGRYSAVSTTNIITFWAFVVFLINSFVFLLIGLEMDAFLLLENILPIAVAIVAVLLARSIVVYGLRLIINRWPPPVPMAWSHVMLWGGMRGAVSLALALSIAGAVQSRSTLLSLVLGTVLFSVIVQGLTLRPLLRRLGLMQRRSEQLAFERELVQLAAAQAAMDALRQFQEEHLLPRRMVQRLGDRFESQAKEHSLNIAHLVSEDPYLAEANVQLAQEEIGHVQKQALQQLLRQGAISEPVYDEYVTRIEEHLRRMSAQDWLESTELMEDLVPQEEAPEDGERE